MPLLGNAEERLLTGGLDAYTMHANFGLLAVALL